MADAQAKVDDFDQLIARTAVGPYKKITVDGLNDPRIVEYREMARKVAIRESKDIMGLIGAKATSTWEGWTALDAALGSQLNADAARLQAAAEQEAADARTRQRNVAFLAGFVVLLGQRGHHRGQPVDHPAARSTWPTQAQDMAGRPPAEAPCRQILETPLGEDVVIPRSSPITVKTRDEVADVAVALNRCRPAPLDLAVEQAVLRRNIADSFVNLGRRNQNLLEPPARLHHRLERNETDPEHLEGLFRLDHLATRMRRNAESLLVLAGIEPPRQWSGPVPLVDVVRGALGEVEDYQRVEVRHLERRSSPGSARSGPGPRPRRADRERPDASRRRTRRSRCGPAHDRATRWPSSTTASA